MSSGSIESAAELITPRHVTPRHAVRGADRLVPALLAALLLAAALGSQNLLTWVEDWPPSGLTDRALAAVGAWDDGMRRLGLTAFHHSLRQWERRLEGSSERD